MRGVISATLAGLLLLALVELFWIVTEPPAVPPDERSVFTDVPEASVPSMPELAGPEPSASPALTR